MKKILREMLPWLKCIIAFLLVIYLTTVLVSWNEVPHYKHYIYLSHPMSKQASSDTHYISADVEFLFTNGDRCIKQEKYSYKIANKQKHLLTIKPRFMSIDTTTVYFSPKINGSQNLQIGSKVLNDNAEKYGNFKVTNIFGAIRFSKDIMGKSQRLQFDSKISPDHKSFVVYKRGNLIDLSSNSWLEEEDFYRLIAGLREWEKKDTRAAIFDFEDKTTWVNTYYGIGSQTADNVEIEFGDNDEYRTIGFIRKLLSPFDISKAQIDLAFIAYQLDSVRLKLRFTEGVSISDFNNKKLAEAGINELSFINMGIGLPEPIYDSFRFLSSGEKLTVIYEENDNRKFKEEDCLSLFINFVESRNLQWIRLFFLTTVIAYLLTRCCKYTMDLYKKLKQ